MAALFLILEGLIEGYPYGPAPTDIENLADTEALDRWEAIHGSILENDGPKDRYLTKAGKLQAR